MAYAVTASSSQTSSLNLVPTTVVMGFLGSGKTTIISHLMEALDAQDKKVIYIKNELGEEDLDAKLMRGKNFVGRDILNGCICCTLVGPFTSAIEEVVGTYNPDRIIIESAGTADPASMALMVSDHQLLSRDGVISIIDVLNFEGYQDLSPVAKRQAEMTDLLVLNKVELVDLDHKRRVVGYVRELNERSPIVEAPGGKLNLELAFGLGHNDLDTLLTDESHHFHKDNHDHLYDDHIEALTYITEAPVDKERFIKALSKLPNQVIRIKGIVNFLGGAEVVNAIFNRVDFSKLAVGMENHGSTRLICIGYRISSLEQSINQVLAESKV